MNKEEVKMAELHELQKTMGGLLEISVSPLFINIKVPSDNLLSLLQRLRNEWGMNYLANLTAVDYGEEFEIIYHLYAIPDQHKLAVKTRIPRMQARLESATSVYPAADWQEREIFDLMGIEFTGHPNLQRILLPESFAGHPLRKDFKQGEWKA